MIGTLRHKTTAVALVLSLLISILVATVAQGQDGRPAPVPRDPVADMLETPLVGVDSPFTNRLDGALVEAEGVQRVIVRMTNPSVAATVFAEGNVAAAVEAMTAQQDAVVAQAVALDANTTVLGRTFRVMNAVMLSIDADAARQLSRDFNVVSVNGITNYELDLTDTVPYIGASAVQDMGYDGSGISVAVLDSGIDYTHANLGGAGTLEAYEAAYGTSNADPLNTTLDGLFPTPKVVGGYDFVGEDWPNSPEAFDPDPIDFEGHGTHVADIIGGLNGVAPGVDLYGVKVCSAVSSSCSGLALIMGMEFAVDPNGDFDTSDAVDIINMSLGANYGTAFDDDLSFAVENASHLGVLTVASAGNSGNNAYSTGTPAAASSALSVAQTAVPSAGLDLMQIVGGSNDGEEYIAIFQDWAAPLTEAIQAPVQYGDGAGGNLNGCAPFDVDLSGKIVLVDRGGCFFSTKIQTIDAAGGLVGIIGLVDGSEPFSGGFGEGDLPDIPGFMVSLAGANAFRATVASGGEVRFDPAATIPLSGTMVGSSARGPAMDTNLIKPEIGAPGASVSAIAGSGDGEGPFGGTSGAAPMVSGAAALVLQQHPWMRPEHIKAVLMNTAETEIYTTATVLNDQIAPITRIGGGEVRVDRAVNAPALFHLWDAVDFYNFYTVSLSFGQVDVHKTRTYTQRVAIKNLTGEKTTYNISAEFRDSAKDTGAVTVSTRDSITLKPYEQKYFNVRVTVDPTLLPDWTMNNGPNGGGAAALDQMEFAGYIFLDDVSTTDDDLDRLHLPWHILPRKAGRIAAPTKIKVNSEFEGIPAGSKKIKNVGVNDVDVSAFSLLRVSDNLPEGDRGEQSPTPDLEYIGYRGFLSSGCDAGWGFEFAVSNHERETHLFPLQNRLSIDTDLDGTADYIVFNYDLGLSPFGSGSIDGQQITMVQDLSTLSVSAFFYVNHPTNSSNMILTVCGEQLGFSDASVAFDTFGMDAQALDFYYGGPGDIETGMLISPLGSRYFPVFDSSGTTGATIPAESADTVNMLDFGPGLSSDIGILIFSQYGEEGREAKAIIAK